METWTPSYNAWCCTPHWISSKQRRLTYPLPSLLTPGPPGSAAFPAQSQDFTQSKDLLIAPLSAPPPTAFALSLSSWFLFLSSSPSLPGRPVSQAVSHVPQAGPSPGTPVCPMPCLSSHPCNTSHILPSSFPHGHFQAPFLRLCLCLSSRFSPVPSFPPQALSLPGPLLGPLLALQSERKGCPGWRGHCKIFAADSGANS